MVLPELGLDALAEAIATSQIAALSGTLFVVSGFLLVLSLGAVFGFLGIIFVFLLVWLIILIAFTMMPGPSYVAIHERLYSTGIAERQANLAVSFGLTPAARSVSPLLLGIGLGLWLFQGGHFVVQGVTEAGSSSKGQILGALFGSVVTAVILFVALLGWQKQVPAALLSAHSWLYLKKSPLCNSSFPGRLTIG